ncbi:MAG: phosphatidylserine/phosphatidylglycerophosphate/cardiolipin synthase family protein [Akkermansiaceae bacterium]|nr:phosphatidylserine/phosphatidylglycerophosphate/cardiolipin synthase family protein [Akkermansiaceae bacterium]NNM28235.1 phosphatidylserine/phosphatidylglycerophosphate/cardiolipin synthase family protein [Akkermansiaceae bacterium]
MNIACAPLLLGVVLLASCAPQRFQPVPASPPPVTTKEFATAMAHVGRAPWTDGNHTVTLENGNGFYAPMLEAIQGARRSITFETFVYKHGTPVFHFTRALAERARAGVKVHMILDGYGARQFSEEQRRLLRDSGAEFYFYRPITWRRPAWSNRRTHRKLLIVDGRVAFTGGANYSEVWMGDGDRPSRWRDTQYEVTGPVVRHFQDIFNDNWREMTGRTLTGPDYYPALAPTGSHRSQAVLGAPEQQGDTTGSAVLLAVNAARESIFIEHAYFLPPRPLVDALVRAAKRGVQIEVLVPGWHTDMPVQRPITRHDLARLHRAGVKLYQYLPTMMHGKLVVIDGHLSIIGSGNLDPRSFWINDENNLHVLSDAFAREQLAMFERDKARSRRLKGWDLVPRPHDLPFRIWKSQL